MNQTTSCIRFVKTLRVSQRFTEFRIFSTFIFFLSLQTLYPDARIKCISDSAFFVKTDNKPAKTKSDHKKQQKYTFLDRLREVDKTHMLKGVTSCVKELSLSSTTCVLQVVGFSIIRQLSVYKRVLICIN